ncbi:alpha/beta hydrolase [Cnuibacter sp. UC19_7]|uniref:alpha/beta hydrolase n=1 Tax=Cnuibacter sp. UC19_7 TaxID=3350166 RepID=UPI00366C8A2D
MDRRRERRSGVADDRIAFPDLHRLRRRRALTRWSLAAVTVGLAVVVLARATPWPSALLIRSVFEKGGAETVAEMTPYVPATGVESLGVFSYADGPDTTLSAFSSAEDEGPLPTVVWIHGGAWISGERGNVAPYLQILAAHGYTTIGLDYTVGPEATYPTAVTQLDQALGYIVDHAEELRIDPQRIVLAGDSAGAQLASQLAVLTTNPRYADLLGLTPSLRPGQLAGVILNCGVYDLRRMADLTGIVAWGFKSALWAYTGTKDWSSTYAGATMSTIDFVTADFPPTYISGGNGDGLTWLQSVPMSQRLTAEGVAVTDLFWPETHQPALPHEYQFHLDYPEAQQALTATLEFLATATAGR